VQGDIYGLSAVKGDGWQILIKEGFEHYNFVSMLQESHEDGVLPCASWGVRETLCQRESKKALTVISATGDKDLRVDV
jgi:hypothetical protein